MGIGNQLEGFGTLAAPGVQIVNLSLGTAATAVQFTGLAQQIARVRIVNLSSTVPVSLTFSTNAVTSAPQVSLGNSAAGASSGAGTFAGAAQSTSATATAFSATFADGIRVQPSTTLEINISLGTRIWIQAGAAATPVQIAALLQNA